MRRTQGVRHDVPGVLVVPDLLRAGTEGGEAMTEDRVIAADLYRAIEGMLFLSANPSYAIGRREESKKAFMDAMELLMERLRK